MPEPIQTPVPAADELAAQVLLLAQSQRDDDALVSVEELSAKQSMPRKFMEAIIADVFKRGLLWLITALLPVCWRPGPQSLFAIRRHRRG